ncbi:MAG: hypothetical protein OEY01_05080 [Desulfobulbaceae bacterium]|nr:hypothetical protein [Desulfobulbaceae bacterium]
MIDIHCHILPGTDDGAVDDAAALAMARVAAKDGVTTIIATPHISDHLLPAAEIKHRTDALNRLLHQANIPVNILPGAEIASHLDITHWGDYRLADGNSVLIEFPHSHFPTSAPNLLRDALAQGLQPIIAHPERNPGIMHNPTLLTPLVALGVRVQLTAQSIVGAFGPAIQQCAYFLLRQNLVHFLASDAHSPDYRTPQLSKGLKIAGKILGKQQALELVRVNPQATLNQ